MLYHDEGPSRRRRRIRRLRRVSVTAAWLVMMGCVGTPVVPGDGSGSNGDGGGGNNGGGSNGDGDPMPATVRLVASNSTPGVGEEVLLTCVVMPAPDAGTDYSFEPADRLDIDERGGTARFIVDVTDVGVSLTFRCAATDNSGETVRSPAVTVIPSG